MARRKYSVDEALVARYLKEGRGTGHGADYKPWLKISDVPSLGRSHRLRGIKTGRVHHFLSDIEVNLFYLLDWHDAVVDIREQFPLDREETQAIAEQAGIRYPVDSHTRVPLVQSTDFLVDYVVAGEERRVAYSVKPVDALSEKRKAELLELERLYWLARDVPWGIVTSQEIPKSLSRNIAWVHNYVDVDDLSQPHPGYYADKAILVLNEIASSRGVSLKQACQALDDRLAMQPGTALLLVRHLIACKQLLCDMSEPMSEASPVENFRAAPASRLGRLG
ncbi:TnsA endonuclease C-terminal domain-containing protein [Novispirillum sp. DQ9]|uniref:TnsA endonuclease C-terminal domain-containing protein n=1 Tax=Novispirillum sp. DQ9 TaxID=3398612 RepID=UPI003C7B4EFB